MVDEDRKENTRWLEHLGNFGDYFKEEDRWKVKFTRTRQTHPEILNGWIMVFKEPIVYKEGFRVIPNHPRYAISKEGTLIDTVTEKILVPTVPENAVNWYPSAELRIFFNQTKKYAGIHRLVALAWCNNDNYYTKVIVNHIDGDKGNFKAENLEWVSYSRNAAHAFEAGLRTDNLRCAIRNIETGEITEFYSLGEMARHFGFSRSRDPSAFTHGPVHKLLLQKYEVRVENDERPWFYKVGDKPVPKSRYITTVTYPDGREKVFWDNRDIMREFKCWNISSGIESVIAKAKELHPELKFSVEDRWKDRIVQTIRISDMSVVDESQWVTNAAKLMGCSRLAVERLLRLGEQRPKNGYAVRYKTEEPWDIKPEEFVGQPIRVRVTDKKTGESIIFDSLRDIERKLSISRYVVQRRIEDKKIYQHYCFELVS